MRPRVLEMLKRPQLILATVAASATSLIALSLLTMSPAIADCVLNGYTYPEGAIVRGRVCRNGEWR